MDSQEYYKIIEEVKREITPHIETLLVANRYLDDNAYHGMIDNINEIVLKLFAEKMPRDKNNKHLHQSKTAAWLNVARGTLRSMVKRYNDKYETYI